jgi:hypothetical protein
LAEKETKMVRLHRISAFVMIILVGRFTSNATTFTDNAIIGHDDLHFEGTDIVVDGCTLIVDGEHTFRSLEVLHGGVITHSEMSTPVLHLIIEEDAFIDASSRIDASGKGYGPGMGPGKGEDGQYWGGGAGHGGRGDTAGQYEVYRDGLGGNVYGNPLGPGAFGSGGGAGQAYEGGAGGGAIRLDVRGTLGVDGLVQADGMEATGVIHLSVWGGRWGLRWKYLGDD